MVLEQTSGGWTATEVDPAVTSDVSLIESASQIRLDQTESRPGNVLFQSLMVLAAAVAAGALVFVVVRAAVSSDANPDEQAMDLNELPSIGLDPEGQEGSTSSGEDSSRSGSQRDTLEDGIPDEETPAAVPTDTGNSSGAKDSAESPDSTGPAGAVGNEGPNPNGADPEDPEDQSSVDADSNPPGLGDLFDPIAGTATTTPAAPTQPLPQLPSLPSLPTTAAPTPTISPTTAAPTTQTTSAPPITSQPTTAPQPTTATTASTTTATTPTTATSTTIASTTTTSIATGTTLAAPSLISAPIEGSVHTWETGILFEAKTTPEAVRYCWELESADTTVRECNADTEYALPGGDAGVDPGIVVVTAEAQDAGGAVLNSETMTLKVIARNLIESPAPGSDHDRGDLVRIDFADIPTASKYCVTLVQDSITLPTVCENNGRVSVRLRRFDSGPVTVNAEVMRGQQIIGRQSMEINYTG